MPLEFIGPFTIYVTQLIILSEGFLFWDFLVLNLSIVFIWSQHDGGNVEQRQWLKFPPKLIKDL